MSKGHHLLADNLDVFERVILSVAHNSSRGRLAAGVLRLAAADVLRVAAADCLDSKSGERLLLAGGNSFTEAAGIDREYVQRLARELIIPPRLMCNFLEAFSVPRNDRRGKTA